MRFFRRLKIAIVAALATALFGCQLIDYMRDTQEELKWPDNFAFSDMPAEKITGMSWAVVRREEASGKLSKVTFVHYWQRLRPAEATEFFIYEDVPSTGLAHKKILDEAVAAAAKDCEGVQFSNIRDASDEMWFEVKAPKCGATPEYVEIDRYMFGIWDVFRLAYRVEGPSMSAQQRADGMKTLESFALVHG